MKLILHSLVLALSFFAVFLEQQFASDYQIQIIALLVIIYFLITFFRRKRMRASVEIHDNITSSLDIFIVNAILMLLILQTGGLYSPIFFLVYFLCFGVTFIFEPFTVFIFAIGIFAIFLPEAITNQALTEFVKLGSVAVIAPFGFFFGREYKAKEKLQQKTKAQQEANKEIAQEVSEVINNEKNISKDSKTKLSDILKKTKQN